MTTKEKKTNVENLLQGFIDSMKKVGTEKDISAFEKFSYSEGVRTATLYMEKYPHRNRINYVDDDIFEFFVQHNPINPNEDIPTITNPNQRYLLYMSTMGYETQDIEAMVESFTAFRKGFRNEIRRIRRIRRNNEGD